MRRRFDWRYALGAALALAAAAVVLLVFARLSRTDARELYLADGAGARFGWRYELLQDGEARPCEPEFGENGGFGELPEGIEAVRIAREMTEEIPNAELEWHSYRDGVEVFLDGALLHTDFPGDVARDSNGFLILTDGDWERLHRAQGDMWRRVRVSLPADYLGGELCVVTYFPEDWGTPVPEYPYLGNEVSYIASFVVPSVAFDVATTAYAILALLIAAVFLLDIPNEGPDGRTALLCLYFLLLFLRQAASSYAGYFSGLYAHLEENLLCELYVAPLYFYLALRLERKWRYPLCAVIVAWTLCECVCWYAGARRSVAGPWSLAVFAAVAAATCADVAVRVRRGNLDRRRFAFYAVAGLCVTLACLFNKFRLWDGARDYLANGIWANVRAGDFEPVVNLVTDIVSMLALIAVVSEFARRTLRKRQEVSVLQDRARQTMESYNRLLTAESATSALHHEMRHHMLALSGILKSGDIERAERYAESVAGDLDRLPTGRYSQNLLVDVIAGSYLDRARAQGIAVEHRLSVPPELDIADEDLSVFLSNMLQNALEACERMDAGAERFIRVEMRLRGKFLFIRCVNGAAEGDGERRRRPGHGYGLTAMRKVAEKYNSALVIERAAGEFSVMSDLCLRER